MTDKEYFDRLFGQVMRCPQGCGTQLVWMVIIACLIIGVL